MTKSNDFEEKIHNAAYKAEQISDIALCAVLASRSICNSAEREKHVAGVLYGIISLCEVLTNELNSITD